MDYTLHEWINLAEKVGLDEAAIQAQSEETGESREKIISTMTEHWNVMVQAAQSGLNPELRSVSGLTGGQAHKLYSSFAEGKLLCGNVIGKATAYALSVAEYNACMGKIVAAPTAGACGILPGVLLAMHEENEIPTEKIVRALFVAGAVGESIATQASISGAEGGCQAECGSAAAMAAAALCFLQDGTPECCCDAAAFALMNLLGLVCDPVDGLVEVPCVYRNVGAVGIAFTSAEMALSGIRCPIDPDDVVRVMKDVGEALPTSLRETGEGGCASCRVRSCTTK